MASRPGAQDARRPSTGNGAAVLSLRVRLMAYLAGIAVSARTVPRRVGPPGPHALREYGGPRRRKGRRLDQMAFLSLRKESSHRSHLTACARSLSARPVML
jgi:hypothetical protein